MELGGLVRAYQDATIKALDNVTYAIEECGMELCLTINYNDIENLKYFCKKNNISIINTQYDKFVDCIIEVNEDEKNKIIKKQDENNFKILDYKIMKEKNIRKNVDI